MSESVSELKNLGPKSEAWLNEIGIFSKTDIERIGPVEIYRLLKQHGLPASLNLVYALEAMLMDIHWTKLPANMKLELKRAVKEFTR
jgi:hypothetical protein